MKLLAAVVSSILLTALAQEQEGVSCLYGRRSSCSLCPVGVSKNQVHHDFHFCAGDCQVEGEGDQQVCVPKETQLSTTAYLKSSNGGRANQRNQDCVRQNIQYWGGINNGTQEDSVENCQEKCRRTPGCTWFNWNHPSCSSCKQTNVCYLFSTKGPRKVAAQGRFSGGVHSRNCLAHKQEGFGDGDVRLTSYPKGRVEIWKDGKWGTLCGHFWWNNQKGAENICQQLGYTGGSKYTAGGGTGPIHAGNRLCSGGEKTIFDCPLQQGRTDATRCSSHTLDQGVDCTGGGGDGAIAEISTKTGGMRSADTDDAVSMTVCDASDNCCTTALDNPGFDDRKKGALNTYSDETVLGDCGSSSISNHLLRGQLTATLSKDGTDGWYVEWAQIKTFGGASFTCMFNVWYSREATSDCTEDVGVTSITTKTGTSGFSGTDDRVSMSVCDGDGTCCSTTLDNPGDDFKRGAANTFTNPKGLGECLTTAMTGPIRATLSKTGSDAWYVDWAQVQLARGVFHTCNFTSWLDDASGYSREITVECNENVGITEISTETGSMRDPDTDDSVTITVCDVSGGCCSNPLNIPSYDDRAVGHVDTYSSPDVLGQCYSFVPARGDLIVTLEKTGSDGWNVQWTKVKLSGGRSFTCNFNTWLNNDDGHSNSATAQCQRDL